VFKNPFSDSLQHARRDPTPAKRGKKPVIFSIISRPSSRVSCRFARGCQVTRVWSIKSPRPLGASIARRAALMPRRLPLLWCLLANAMMSSRTPLSLKCEKHALGKPGNTKHCRAVPKGLIPSNSARSRQFPAKSPGDIRNSIIIF